MKSAIALFTASCPRIINQCPRPSTPTTFADGNSLRICILGLAITSGCDGGSGGGGGGATDPEVIKDENAARVSNTVYELSGSSYKFFARKSANAAAMIVSPEQMKNGLKMDGSLSTAELTKEVFKVFDAKQFDFVIYVMNADSLDEKAGAYGYHEHVFNDTKGIGLDDFNQRSQLGLAEQAANWAVSQQTHLKNSLMEPTPLVSATTTALGPSPMAETPSHTETSSYI